MLNYPLIAYPALPSSHNAENHMNEIIMRFLMKFRTKHCYNAAKTRTIFFRIISKSEPWQIILNLMPCRQHRRWAGGENSSNMQISLCQFFKASPHFNTNRHNSPVCNSARLQIQLQMECFGAKKQGILPWVLPRKNHDSAIRKSCFFTERLFGHDPICMISKCSWSSVNAEKSAISRWYDAPTDQKPYVRYL